MYLYLIKLVNWSSNFVFDQCYYYLRTAGYKLPAQTGSGLSSWRKSGQYLINASVSQRFAEIAH